MEALLGLAVQTLEWTYGTLKPAPLHIWDMHHFFVLCIPNHAQSFCCTVLLDYRSFHNYKNKFKKAAASRQKLLATMHDRYNIPIICTLRWLEWRPCTVAIFTPHCSSFQPKPTISINCTIIPIFSVLPGRHIDREITVYIDENRNWYY